MMTLEVRRMRKPPPVMPELEPTPSTVVPPLRSMMPHPDRMPEMRITLVPELTADRRAEQDVTVVPDPEPPPVVPWPNPTS